jgi:alkanesulfonate monooxygenase SsuD/methylene tetrahydromethanopterin reductase-like flavin-dependent oxidoreductase (luciferase family)
VRIGVKPGQWGWSYGDLKESWTAAEDAGFDILSCFDHVTSAPADRCAWEAPSLLVAMAGATSRIGLAVHVLNMSLRNPFVLAAQLAVAQAESEGRLEVGLGAGSYHLARFDHRAAGVPFPSHRERTVRLEACCEVFPRLWRGEVVDDSRLELREASLGPIGIAAPRIVVGGTGETALEIAARHADAWNANASDPSEFAGARARLEAACARLGRDRSIERQVQLFARELDLQTARHRLDEFEEAGADTAVLVLDSDGGGDPVRRLADAVL